jgi:hypothetical protein
VFIDGFGLYRNSYRSLVGVYAIPAGLDGDDRHRPANVFPITSSPHESNFNDVAGALQSLANLDGGVTVMINGKQSILCVPTVCYLGSKIRILALKALKRVVSAIMAKLLLSLA